MADEERNLDESGQVGSSSEGKPPEGAEGTPSGSDQADKGKPPAGFVPEEALREERAKRREAENQANVLRGRMEALEQTRGNRGGADDGEVDLFSLEDERGGRSRGRSRENPVVTALNRIRSEMWANNVKIQERILRREVGDENYDKAFEAFERAAEKDPALWNRVRLSASPPDELFKIGSDILEPKDKTWEEKKEAEIRAKVIRDIEERGGRIPPAAPTGGGGGKSGPSISAAKIANMTDEDFAKLSEEEQEAYLSPQEV